MSTENVASRFNLQRVLSDNLAKHCPRAATHIGPGGWYARPWAITPNQAAANGIAPWLTRSQDRR
jgi:hypothetical protein